MQVTANTQQVMRQIYARITYIEPYCIALGTAIAQSCQLVSTLTSHKCFGP